MFISSQCGCWFQSGAQLLSPSAPLWFGDPRADFLLDRNGERPLLDCSVVLQLQFVKGGSLFWLIGAHANLS